MVGFILIALASGNLGTPLLDPSSGTVQALAARFTDGSYSPDKMLFPLGKAAAAVADWNVESSEASLAPSAKRDSTAQAAQGEPEKRSNAVTKAGRSTKKRRGTTQATEPRKSKQRNGSGSTEKTTIVASSPSTVE